MMQKTAFYNAKRMLSGRNHKQKVMLYMIIKNA